MDSDMTPSRAGTCLYGCQWLAVLYILLLGLIILFFHLFGHLF